MGNLRLRTPADFGALLRDRRKALGMDQAELAKAIGVSRYWVNQTERGNPGAALGNVLRALAVLGVELSTSNETPTPEAEPVTTPDINAIIERARRKAKL
jgi:HTH-type transcriptional regulator / antitoxin HipB